MKKINLFFSALMICLALLIAGGATVPALQFSALTVNTASNTDHNLSGKYLFDNKGRYAVPLADLETGATFQFFGFDWRVVKVNGTVATFWMADPYASHAFNTVSKSGKGIYNDGSNIWANGYSNTIWTSTANGQVELKDSNIRLFLQSEAKTLITDSNYKYKGKVIPGYVDGINEPQNTTSRFMDIIAYAEQSTSNVTEKGATTERTESANATNKIEAKWDLSTKDIWWLPSVDEIMNMWDLHSNIIAWTESTTSNRAWTRTPDLVDPKSENKSESCYAMTVRFDADKTSNYAVNDIKDSRIGVRPAIHMDITNIATEYEEHIKDAGNGNSNGKGGWFFNDEWMKVFFIVVCVLGIIGVVLVIVAVVVKSRQQNQAN